MPRYYFRLRNNGDITDVEGTELADPEAAREHATAVARELTFKRRGMLDRDWSQWTMSVLDSEGMQLLSFRLADFENGDPKDHAERSDSSPETPETRRP
jgi:Domain of unknown function (DUF6894)